MPHELVLVVDDHEAGRFAKVRTLRRAGFEVIEAGTGRDAMSLVEERSPDVVILDVNLPDISGTEVSRRLRAGPDGDRSIPILQVSSTAISAADQAYGLEQGADVYVTEPVDPAVLIAAVRALVRARVAERALAEALRRERAARMEAEDAVAVKNDFIATLSHELRTPLNALLGTVWQLRHAALDDAARGRALQRIERNAVVQAQLVNDLLDLSRIAKGKLALVLHLADMAAIVRESVDAVKPAAVQKGISVDLDLEQAFAIADPARMQQVVTNLLTNAVQFTDTGGRIAAHARVEGHDVVIQVDDTGAGIDEAFLPLVFEQFRQGEAGLSRKHGGLGLGLSVVRQLVEVHGGRVSASSAGPNQGASFRVVLPVEVVPASAATPTAQGALEGLHVLAVAMPATSEIPRVIESSGGGVAEAASVNEALQSLATIECDVILGSNGLRDALKLARDKRGRQPMFVPIDGEQTPVSVVRTIYRSGALTLE